ncbi:MAG: hypothetical protein K2L17_09860 [Muribaculaceae bacterium]|nr:hypothetical protein [Muribaculaceae bacterium]
MKIRHLLALSAAYVAVASASAFEWTPAIQQPNPSIDITQVYQLETMRISAEVGLAATNVMPIWIDENGNEIAGTYSSNSDPAWGDYVYDFNFSDFKCNGEYTLQFPEGLLKNAAGELSDPKEFYYTVEVPELASAMFDDFKVLSVSPDFSQPQGLWDEQLVKVNTNHNDAIGYTELLVSDNTTGESVTISSNYTVGRSLGDSSEISWNVVGSFRFFEGHDYSAEFVFYNGIDKYSSDGVPTPVVARETYKFTGKVEGYKYSDITLLSITPAPYTVTISEPSQAVFTYTFSGPVNVYKAATPKGQFGITEYPASCLSSNADKTVWTLDLSNDEYVKSVDAELVIYVYVRDLDGSQLKGDDGEDDNAYYIAGWQCDLGAKEIVVVTPTRGETLDSLTEVVVKSASGDVMSYNWGEIAIQDLLDNTLGTLFYEQPEGEEGGAAAEFHFTKWIPDGEWSAEPLNIVAEGSYKIYFPTGTFVFGEQFESVNSRSLYSGFQITGNLDDTPDDPVVDPAEQEVFFYDSVSPEDGSTVASLDVVKLWYPDMVNTFGKDAIVYNKADQSIVSDAQVLYDWDDIYLIKIELLDPVTEAGEYEIVIPRGAICSNEFFDSDGKAGICNPEFRLSYTVDPNGADDPVDPQEALEYTSVYPEMGSKVESLSQIVLSFAEEVTCDDFTVEVYSVARNVVATGNGRTDFMEPNRIVIDFNEPIVEDGTYEVVIPNHVIINGDYYESDGKEGLCNPEYRLYYTVASKGSDDPVNPTEQEVFNYTSVDPESGSTLSELSHISLIFPDVVMTWNTTGYVYKADAVDSDPVAEAVIGWDMMDEYLINVNLNTTIAEDGAYVVVIPARSICDDAFFMSEGKKGICNPEIRLNYTVDKGGSVASIAEISDCDVYDLQGNIVLRNASSADIKTLAKGIYVVGGKKVVVK